MYKKKHDSRSFLLFSPHHLFMLFYNEDCHLRLTFKKSVIVANFSRLETWRCCRKCLEKKFYQSILLKVWWVIIDLIIALLALIDKSNVYCTRGKLMFIVIWRNFFPTLQLSWHNREYGGSGCSREDLTHFWRDEVTLSLCQNCIWREVQTTYCQYCDSVCPHIIDYFLSGWEEETLVDGAMRI